MHDFIFSCEEAEDVIPVDGTVIIDGNCVKKRRHGSPESEIGPGASMIKRG